MIVTYSLLQQMECFSHLAYRGYCNRETSIKRQEYGGGRMKQMRHDEILPPQIQHDVCSQLSQYPDSCWVPYSIFSSLLIQKTISCTVFIMQIHFRTLGLLYLSLIFPSVLAASSKQCLPSEDHRSCQTATCNDIEIREAIRSTVIYSSGATVGMTSACHLASNHLQRSQIIPWARCFALGVGTGIITAASHARLTYTEDAWRWVEERIVGYWTMGWLSSGRF